MREMAIDNVTDKDLGPPKPPTPMAKFRQLHASIPPKTDLTRTSTGEFLRRANSPNNKRGMMSPRARAAAAARNGNKKMNSNKFKVTAARDERHPKAVDSLDVALSQHQVRN